MTPNLDTLAERTCALLSLNPESGKVMTNPRDGHISIAADELERLLDLAGAPAAPEPVEDWRVYQPTSGCSSEQSPPVGARVKIIGYEATVAGGESLYSVADESGKRYLAFGSELPKAVTT